MKKLISVSMFLFFYSLLHAQQNITAIQAKNYVGKTMQVCDIIKEATLDNISKDEATILYTGTSFKNRTLALVFTKKVLKAFSYNPVSKMINQKFCAKGKISMYKKNRPCI